MPHSTPQDRFKVESERWRKQKDRKLRIVETQNTHYMSYQGATHPNTPLSDFYLNDISRITKFEYRALARILKLPVIFERVPVQNGVEWSKKG